MSTTSEEVRSASSRSAGPGTIALRVLATVAVGIVLFVGRAAFVPIALAVLFSLILTTPVEALQRRGLSRSAAAILILLVLLSLVGETVNLLWTPAQTWWASAPQTMRTIEKKVRPASKLFNRVEMLTDRAGQIGATSGASPQTAAASIEQAALPPPAAQAPRRPGAQARATYLKPQRTQDGLADHLQQWFNNSLINKQTSSPLKCLESTPSNYEPGVGGSNRSGRATNFHRDQSFSDSFTIRSCDEAMWLREVCGTESRKPSLPLRSSSRARPGSSAS